MTEFEKLIDCLEQLRTSLVNVSDFEPHEKEFLHALIKTKTRPEQLAKYYGLTPLRGYNIHSKFMRGFYVLMNNLYEQPHGTYSDKQAMHPNVLKPYNQNISTLC